jgi:hypothetical protein
MHVSPITGEDIAIEDALARLLALNLERASGQQSARTGAPGSPPASVP